MADSDPNTNTVPPVTGEIPSLTGRWVRLLLGFSVSVAIGLAPYLGKLNVPLFTPMLSLIPESLQEVAIPLSAASMGLVAVLVQWQGTRPLRPGQLQTWFNRSIVICIVTLIVLASIEMVAVARVDVLATGSTVSFAVGPENPNVPPCTGLSRAECIKTKLTLDEAKIDSYFGELQVNITKLALVLVYVSFMSTFGMLVGLVLLAQREKEVLSSVKP
jgi:hypothetical protein